MKMAKASEKDIDAAGDAMSVLNDIASGYYPKRDDDECKDTFFDPDEPEHLRKFYDLMSATMDASPGWPGRVIGGMCYVILYDKNRIVDPDADVLELHPRFAQIEAQRDEIQTMLNTSEALREKLVQQRGDLLALLGGILKCQRGMLGHLFLEGWQEQVIREAIAKHQPTTAGEGPATPT